MSSSDIKIPFPLSSAPGARAQEGTGRLINCFAESRGDSPPIWRRAPGLVNFGTTPHEGGCRGLIEISGILYSAWDGKIETHSTSGGASTALTGALPGSRKGFFARNNKSPTPDQWFVDPDGNIATFSLTPSPLVQVNPGWPDNSLPAVNSTCVINGYGVFTSGQGLAYATDLNSTDVNALSFGSANAKPDGLVRAVAFGGNLFLFGNNTTEIWTDRGLTPFPFTRSYVIPRGLAGPYCVAGDADGFGKALIWVGDDNRVHRLDGYTPTDISPPDLDRLIEAVADKTTLDACAYMSGGHAFFELSSATWTWVFDINTEKWHERQKYLGNPGAQPRNRITSTIHTDADRWLCGDIDSGNIQQITSAAYQVVGEPHRFRIESGPVENFPNRIRVARADFDFVMGVGSATGIDPIETNPEVSISWSDDGGVNWSNPVLRRLGAQGETKARLTLLNTGLSGPQGRRWRLDVSDPVYVGFLGGVQSAEPRQK